MRGTATCVPLSAGITTTRYHRLVLIQLALVCVGVCACVCACVCLCVCLCLCHCLLWVCTCVWVMLVVGFECVRDVCVCVSLCVCLCVCACERFSM